MCIIHDYCMVLAKWTWGRRFLWQVLKITESKFHLIMVWGIIICVEIPYLTNRECLCLYQQKRDFPGQSNDPPCYVCYDVWSIILLPPGLSSYCWAAWRCPVPLSPPSPWGCFSWFQTGSSSHYKSADGEHRESRGQVTEAISLIKRRSAEELSAYSQGSTQDGKHLL